MSSRRTPSSGKKKQQQRDQRDRFRIESELRDAQDESRRRKAARAADVTGTTRRDDDGVSISQPRSYPSLVAAVTATQ